MKKEQILWFLENININNGHASKEKDTPTLDRQVHKEFKKGEYIFLPNDHADKIYFVFEGQVKIGNYGDAGKEITKVILGRGEVFGELAMIAGHSKRRDFACATEKTSISVVNTKEARLLMRKHNEFNNFMMQAIGRRLIDVEKRLESLVFKNSRSRVVEYLHTLGKRQGQRVGYEVLVRKFNTHQEIANLTATSRQTATTILNELRNKNILTFNRKRLLIRDMNLLQQEIMM